MAFFIFQDMAYVEEQVLGAVEEVFALDRTRASCEDDASSNQVRNFIKAHLFIKSIIRS